VDGAVGDLHDNTVNVDCTAVVTCRVVNKSRARYLGIAFPSINGAACGDRITFLGSVPGKCTVPNDQFAAIRNRSTVRPQIVRKGTIENGSDGPIA
jgi:hypothetical protein